MPRVKTKIIGKTIDKNINSNQEAVEFMNEMQQSVYVYAIMKGHNIAGRIMAKFAKTGGIRICVQTFDDPSRDKVIYISPTQIHNELRGWLRLDKVEDRGVFETLIMKRVILFSMSEICYMPNYAARYEADDWMGLFNQMGYTITKII